MQPEQEKIMRMVEEGTISAEEAKELLDAIEQDFDEMRSDGEHFELGDELNSKEMWRRPFGLFMVISSIGGALLIRTRRSSGLASLMRGILLFPLTFISAFAAVLIYLSKDSPWLHIRVRSADQEKVTISLPFPLNIVRGGLQFISSQISDEEIGEKMDAATEFLEAVENTSLTDPVTIDIAEGGDSVQLFLG